MATTINADPVSVYAAVKGVQTTSNPNGRDPNLDITYNCLGYDRFQNANQGVAYAYTSVSHTSLGVDFTATVTAYGTASGSAIVGGVISDSTVTAYATVSAEALLVGRKSNWVKWSDIGNLDFTIGRDNIAGERPLDWFGFIWVLRKLGNNVIAYGENGVSVLTPVENTYGLQTIHRVGLYSRDAFAGNDFIHFFIDKLGRLYQYTDSIKPLDYREYLADLTSPVMSFDQANNLLYICDGTYGFVYSLDTGSMGHGPANITGLGYRDGTQYAVSTSTVIIPEIEIWTDIYDFGTRKGKNLKMIEIGTDAESVIRVSVRFRKDRSGTWKQTNWYPTDSRGVAYVTCYGTEFKFGIKSDTYESFEIDYMRIEGVANAY